MRFCSPRSSWFVGGWLLVACASREVPASFPASSPASLVAPEPARPAVTRALLEEPPLPGEPSQGWSALEGGAAASAASSVSGEGGKPASSGSNEAASAASYVCPMHSDVVSDRPGQCPPCGMALVKRP